MTQLKKVALLFRSEINFMNSMLFGCALAMKIFLKSNPTNLNIKKNLTAFIGLSLLIGVLNFMLDPPLNDGFLFVTVYVSTLIVGPCFFLLPLCIIDSKSEVHPILHSIFAIVGLFPFFYYVSVFTLIMRIEDRVFGFDLHSFTIICVLTIVRIGSTWGAFYFFKKYYISMNFEDHFDNSIKLALNRIGFKLTYNKLDWMEFDKIPENKMDDDGLIGLELSCVSKYKFSFYLVLIALQILFYIWVREKTGI